MLAADAVQWQAQLKAGLPGLTRDTQRQAELGRWGDASDRQTTADAMHAVMTTDLRDSIASITAPTLVLGSWAGYQPMGGTEHPCRLPGPVREAAGRADRDERAGFPFPDVG